jgi:hypothetical protein
MLGISSGLMYQNYPSGCPELIVSYRSDFSTGVDDWAAQGVQGTLTLEANTSPPPSSELGWLKCSYDTTQDSGSSGIKLDVSRWSEIVGAGNAQVGDVFTISYDIFMGSGADFGYLNLGMWNPEQDPNDGDPVSHRVQQYAIAASNDVPIVGLRDVTHISQTITCAGNTAMGLVLDVIDANDLPQRATAEHISEGTDYAVFYIKNIVAEVHRPCP